MRSQIISNLGAFLKTRLALIFILGQFNVRDDSLKGIYISFIVYIPFPSFW